MASSTAQELSQESDELHASYFTHHLIVALRGAADADGDGRVSLDEAYRYAYRRTLASTAQTQVGGQHVTLDTDLAGQGEVPVTYPAESRSQLELPGSLEARILIQQTPSGNVVAEVQKARGAPLRLAFASGTYQAIVRETASVAAGRALRCKLSLSDERVTALDLGACEGVRLSGAGVKGDDEPDDPVASSPSDGPQHDVALPSGPARAVEPWAIEGGFGFMSRTEDAFTRRLQTFGYARDRGIIETPRVRATLGVSRGFLPHLAVGLQLATLGGDTYKRTFGDSADNYRFDVVGTNVFLRVSTELFGHAQPGSRHLDLYGQAGLGMTLGIATLTTGNTRNAASEKSTQTDFGYVVDGAAGVSFVTAGLFAFFAQGGYAYAPTTKNLLGDVHDAGGPSGQLGIRLQLGQ